MNGTCIRQEGWRRRTLMIYYRRSPICASWTACVILQQPFGTTCLISIPKSCSRLHVLQKWMQPFWNDTRSASLFSNDFLNNLDTTGTRSGTFVSSYSLTNVNDAVLVWDPFHLALQRQRPTEEVHMIVPERRPILLRLSLESNTKNALRNHCHTGEVVRTSTIIGGPPKIPLREVL